MIQKLDAGTGELGGADAAAATLPSPAGGAILLCPRVRHLANRMVVEGSELEIEVIIASNGRIRGARSTSRIC